MNTRQHQHQSRQAIHNQHDREWGRPVAKPVHAQYAGRSSVGTPQQREGNC